MKKKSARSPKVQNQKQKPLDFADIKNEKEMLIKNGLADALGLNDGLAGIVPTSIGTPLTQVDTLFKNERWYLVSNMRQLLSQVYVEHGLIQTVIDVPVDDGMRGGIEINTEELGEDEIKDLMVEVEREDILNSVVGQAVKWNRLYGGAGILIMTDQDPETPLDINAIGPDTPLEFRAVDMWELFWDKQNTEGYNMELQEQNYEFYNYYAKKIHKSRVMKMKGITAPSFVRPRLRGWGFSIVEAIINAINPYLKSNNLVFEVLDEFKVDVYKIKNLTNTLLSPDGASAVQKRIQLANKQKNFQHAITMDGEDDFIQKELSFAGIAETMQQVRMQIASELRMPLTKIFGISAQGFNSGEDDIENYNGMVESQVRAKCKYDILKILELKCQKKFGFIPADLQINFKPLRVMSSEQEENVKNAKFSRLLQARQAGELSAEEFRFAINKDNLLNITLDTSAGALEDLEVEKEEQAQNDDKGANKEDKQKGAALKKPAKSTTGAKNPEKTKNESDARHVVTVGLVSGDQILTGKRRDNGLWTNPGGHMEPGEKMEDAACREVFEESGIEIQPGQLQHLSSMNGLDREGKPLVVHAFKATVPKEKTTVKNDPDKEIQNWKWVNLSPDSPELKLGQRHAERDHVLEELLPKYKPADDRIEFDSLSQSVKNSLVSEAHEFRIMNPGKVDERLWEKAKRAAATSGADDKWAFTTWWYKKQGGTFK